MRRAVESELHGVWNVGSRSRTSIEELANTCASQLGVPLLKTFKDVGEAASLNLNWVDDGKARRDLGHKNRVDLVTGIESIATSLQGDSGEVQRQD